MSSKTGFNRRRCWTLRINSSGRSNLNTSAGLKVHCRGIEPRSPAWQARILPLNQQCCAKRNSGAQQQISKKEILEIQFAINHVQDWATMFAPLSPYKCNCQCLQHYSHLTAKAKLSLSSTFSVLTLVLKREWSWSFSVLV